MTELAERGPSLARRLRRGVKEPAQRAFAWAAVRGLDMRPRAVAEVAAMEPRAIVAARTSIRHPVTKVTSRADPAPSVRCTPRHCAHRYVPPANQTPTRGGA